MKQIRSQVLLLVSWLVLMFNVERLDANNSSIINLSASFYILAAMIVALVLIVPLRRRELSMASLGVVALYVLLKGLDREPLFAGVQKYLTITEIAGLLISAGLTWRVSQTLYDFQEAVASISIPTEISSWLPFDKLREHLHVELDRARRYQQPLSLALIAVVPETLQNALHQAVRDAQASLARRYAQVRLGTVLSQGIRDSDMVALQPETGHFLLLAPATSAEQMAKMLHRVSHRIEEQTQIGCHYSIAAYPDGALTSGDLIAQVSEALQRGQPAAQIPGDAAAGELAVAVGSTAMEA